MDEQTIQDVADEIAEVLKKHKVVLARGLFQDELSLVIRPQEDGENPQKLWAFGRNVYCDGKEVDPLYTHEREAYDAWKKHYQKEQKELMQIPELADIVRAHDVKLRTHSSFYDGPLTGLCYHDNRWAFYAVIEQYTNGLTPRIFCLWYLDPNQTKLAEDFYQTLKGSGWSHLAYDDEGKRGTYEGGRYPAKELSEKLFTKLNSYRAWISDTFGEDLQNFEAKHPPADKNAPQPDRWFTPADRSNQDRSAELAYLLEMQLDNLVEQWDCGYKVTFPKAD